jgi:hypothetical protein
MVMKYVAGVAKFAGNSLDPRKNAAGRVSDAPVSRSEIETLFADVLGPESALPKARRGENDMKKRPR